MSHSDTQQPRHKPKIGYPESCSAAFRADFSAGRFRWLATIIAAWIAAFLWYISSATGQAAIGWLGQFAGNVVLALVWITVVLWIAVAFFSWIHWFRARQET